METRSLFISAIIGTEILSLIICLLLLFGTKIVNHRNSRRTFCFALLVLSTMIGCSSDVTSWILDGNTNLDFTLYITTLISMIMTMITMGIFFSYLYAYISEKQPISKKPIHIAWILVVVGVVATLITSLTGNLFTFKNGLYVEGPLYSIYVVVNIIYILIGLAAITAYRKALDFYDKVAAYAYMLIPMISAIITLFKDEWDFSYSAIVLSLLVLYIIIQSDRVKVLEKEGVIINYQAMHDELTGLYNRKAYQKRLDIIKLQNNKSGVIFGDLNGLKYANDNYGHEAGDQLLIRYAKILSKIFRNNEIYRISGDEFICILENVSEEVFQSRVSTLEDTLNKEQPPLACIGAVYGANKDIETMIKEAENKMYVEKKIVHDRYPKIKR